jgi:hypothetical protein
MTPRKYAIRSRPDGQPRGKPQLGFKAWKAALACVIFSL